VAWHGHCQDASAFADGWRFAVKCVSQTQLQMLEKCHVEAVGPDTVAVRTGTRMLCIPESCALAESTQTPLCARSPGKNMDEVQT